MSVTRTIVAASGNDSILKVQLINASSGQFWDAVGLNMEVYVAAQILRYDIAVTETATGSGAYIWTVPATLPASTYLARPRYTDTGDYLATTSFHWTGTAIASVPTGQPVMTVGEARDWVRQWARNAKSSDAYTNTEIDRAVSYIGDDVMDRTGFGRALGSAVVTANTNNLDCSVIDGFTPDRVRRAWIEDQQQPIDIVGYEMVRQLIINGGFSGGFNPADSPYYLLGAGSGNLITKLAFIYDTTTAKVWGTPTANTTIQILWQPEFTSWTFGSDDSTELNLPPRYLKTALVWGAAAALQAREPEHAQTNLDSDKKYLEAINRMMNGSGLGTKSFQAEHVRL